MPAGEKEIKKSKGKKSVTPKKTASSRKEAQQLKSNKKPGKELSRETAKKQSHELEVHQIKLKQQKEELEQTQAQLEEARDKYIDLYDFAPIGYFSIDKKGMICEVNLSGAKMLGLERHYLLKKRFHHFITPECKDNFHKHLGEVFASTDSKQCKVKCRRNDGAVFYAQLESTSFDRRDGRSIMRIALLDVTESAMSGRALELKTDQLRETHDELKIEKGRLEAVMQALPVGIAITDCKGATIMSNKVFDQIWGENRPKTESINDYIHYKAWWADTGKPIAISEWASARSVKEGKPVVGQVLEIERFDGFHAYIINSASPIRNATGEIIGSAVAIQEVTNLKQAERELKSANATKDQFLSSLSHELRTPLTPVLLAIEGLLQDQNLPQRVHDDLEVVNQNLSMEVQLIDDLLDVSGIRDGKLKIKKMPVDLVKVLREVSRICASGMKAKKQILTLNLPDTPCMVLGDAGRLRQVFWNLMRNANKYTKKGGGITVNLYVHDEEHPSYIIKITDTGIGLAPDDLNLIFTPFEQIREKGTITGGLGLGLTICKGIVEKHGGKIRASSTGKDRGTTITVELPLMVEQSAVEKRGVPTAPAPEEIKLKILLVEDEAATAEILSRELRRQSGHTVKTASSVKEALAAVEDHEYEILICDLGLPDGTGQDLMRELIARGNPICGVALSGYGMPEEIKSALQAGFKEHLTKPTKIKDILEVLQRLARRD